MLHRHLLISQTGYVFAFHAPNAPNAVNAALGPHVFSDVVALLLPSLIVRSLRLKQS